jgi:hypothetical protein
MSLAYDPRMSLGARSMGGPTAPPPPRQTYSFPILSYKEIVQCMHELQFRLTDTELAEADKHKDSIRRVYEHLVERCTGENGTGALYASCMALGSLCGVSTASKNQPSSCHDGLSTCSCSRHEQ